jgi:putative transposase
MYRILDAYAEIRKRRNQLRHLTYIILELVATGPNRLWNWDISKLKDPAKWVYYFYMSSSTSSVATWSVG